MSYLPDNARRRTVRSFGVLNSKNNGSQIFGYRDIFSQLVTFVTFVTFSVPADCLAAIPGTRMSTKSKSESLISGFVHDRVIVELVTASTTRISLNRMFAFQQGRHYINLEMREFPFRLKALTKFRNRQRWNSKINSRRFRGNAINDSLGIIMIEASRMHYRESLWQLGRYSCVLPQN